MAWTGNEAGFIAAILRGVGAPNTAANRRALAAWAQAEGGSARWNPFNTTQSAAGASSYNSIGVKNYTSYQQGLHATIQTLRNGYYGHIISALRRGNNPLAVASAVGSSPWGTSGTLMAQVLGGHISVPSGGGAPPSSGGGGGGGGQRRPPNTAAALALLMQSYHPVSINAPIPQYKTPADALNAVLGPSLQSSGYADSVLPHPPQPVIGASGYTPGEMITNLDTARRRLLGAFSG